MTSSRRRVARLRRVPAPDPSRRAPFVADAVDTAVAASFEALDIAPNYCDWIVDLCAPHLDGPVLEVGAGRGTLTERYAAFGDVTAVEPCSRAASLLADRYGDDARVTTIAGLVGDVSAEPVFASAVMINVLERIDDDQGALREIFDRLEPGGRLCVWAPTYEFLYSEFDAELCRVRRYRKRQLEADVRLAGYEVVEGRHVNLPGWLVWLILCRLLRRDPTAPAFVKTVDRWLVPAVRRIEERIWVPIGQTVFLVARKPG